LCSEMAAIDVDMKVEARPPAPHRVERLIDPTNPLREFFDAIPGFHSEIKVTERKDEARFLELERLIATTELLKSKYPQYDYSIDEVKSRSAERTTINANILSEESKHKKKIEALEHTHAIKMRNMKRQQQMLNQLEQIDDNLLIIDKEIEATAKATDAKRYKEARKERLAAQKHARNEAYAEALASQDARRAQEVKRRRTRLSPPMPALVPDEQEYEEEDEVPFAAASA